MHWAGIKHAAHCTGGSQPEPCAEAMAKGAPGASGLEELLVVLLWVRGPALDGRHIRGRSSSTSHVLHACATVTESQAPAWRRSYHMAAVRQDHVDCADTFTKEQEAAAGPTRTVCVCMRTAAAVGQPRGGSGEPPRWGARAAPGAAASPYISSVEAAEHLSVSF